MRFIWNVAERSFKRQLTYRTATLAGLVTNFYFGLLRAALLIALFSGRSIVDGISLQAAVTFTGLSQSIIAYISLFGWFDIIRSIHTGDISTDLLKPVSYYNYWLAQDLGRAAAQMLLRGFPLMVGYMFFFDLLLPATFGHWLWLVISLLLALLVSFSWRFLVNLAGFWIPNAVSIARVAFGLSWFLSGFMMPLRFFPDWFVRICYLTPFPHTINTVVEVFLGLLTPGQIVRALFWQLAWFVGLTYLGGRIMRLGVQKLVIQGG